LDIDDRIFEQTRGEKSRDTVPLKNGLQSIISQFLRALLWW
jgi:hypothetical protein